MKTWKFTVTLKVNECWVEDGFNLSNRINELKQYFEEQLIPYATEGEITAEIKITKAPRKEDILKSQGYHSMS